MRIRRLMRSIRRILVRVHIIQNRFIAPNLQWFPWANSVDKIIETELRSSSINTLTPKENLYPKSRDKTD